MNETQNFNTKLTHRKLEKSSNFLKFRNYLMKNGEKVVADKILTEVCMKFAEELLKIHNKNYKGAKTLLPQNLKIINMLIKKISFTFFIKEKKKGKSNFLIKIPYPLKLNQQRFMGMKLLLKNAKKRKGIKLTQKLTEELVLTLYNKSKTLKEKQKIYQVVKKNIGLVKRKLK